MREVILVDEKDSIFVSAQKELLNETLDSLLEVIEASFDDDPNWKEAILEKFEGILNKESDDSDSQPESPLIALRDSLRENSTDTLASKGSISIREIREDDKRKYAEIRNQWFRFQLPDEIQAQSEDFFWSETQEPYAFYAMISVDGCPVGYIAIKDTRAAVWEIAEEIEKDQCFNGIGTISTPLFVQAISKATGKKEFRATVEVDNLPCQRCLEKIKAKLVGLSAGVLLNEAACKKFEKENADRIDSHMRNLANKLGVDASMLLSHVLEYRINVDEMEHRSK